MPDTKPLQCPRCDANLIRQKTPAGFRYVCESCGGVAANLPILQHERVSDEYLKTLWKAIRGEDMARQRRCPHCSRLMAEIKTATPSGEILLDICQPCQSIWFDTDELEKLPRKPLPIPEKPIPEEARNAMLAVDLETLRDKFTSISHRPFSWSKTLGTIFDFPGEDNDTPIAKPPYITWGLITLVIVTFVISLTEKSTLAFEYGLVPYMGDWTYTRATFDSYLSLYSIIPLIYTLYFLLIFGDNAESKLGKIRFLLLMILSHGAGLLAAYSVYPELKPPIFGCGAVVVGIMAYYAVLFPRARITIIWYPRGHFFWWMGSGNLWHRFRPLSYLLIFAGLSLWDAIWLTGGPQYLGNKIGIMNIIAQFGGLALGLTWGLLTPKSRRETGPPVVIK
jgi:membrane associated rhomboid family serine protease/Zn-finger nucleic acid-binding protein